MASFDTRPTLDLQAGRQVLDDDLPKALTFYEVEAPEALGWRRVGPCRLLMALTGVFEGRKDEYLLRLDFKTGREWPPSAQFVDPTTFQYGGLQDQHHLPKIQGSGVHVHAAYTSPGCQSPIQLICCSATFEYYDTLHGHSNLPQFLWQETDTFLHTLNAIQRGMADDYHGRFPRHG